MLLLAFVPTAGAAKRITGKLSASGLTVIALNADGAAASTQTKPNGEFKLRPTTKRVSLHLRGLDGTYGGPIVIDKKGKRGKTAILGVKAGAELGKVKVRDAHAKLRRDLPDEDQDRKQTARAQNGVPIGAGNFGRVAAAPTGTSGPGRDLDLDGIPGALDIDDDGDLVLDDVDADTGSAVGATGARQGVQGFNAFTSLSLGNTPTPTKAAIVNANAPGLDDEQIQSGLRARGTLTIGIHPFSTELDCAGEPDPNNPEGWIGGLSYCTRGGTGRADPSGDHVDPELMPFPGSPGGQFDSDGDGLGSLDPASSSGGAFPVFQLHTGAGADQIRAGDLLIQRDPSTGDQQGLPAALNTVPVTVPAIARYVDELGTTNVISYPVEPGTTFPVAEDPNDADSDVTVSLTLWRPQRRPIPDELPPGAGNWVDIGHLRHNASPGGGTGQGCPPSSYSAIEQEMVPTPQDSSLFLNDSVADQAADPGNTFSYTLNLSQCFASQGLMFEPGASRGFVFSAALPPKGGQPFNAAASIYTFQRSP